MSTKSSLALYEWAQPMSVHIYEETLDRKYYIETETEGPIELPKKIAEKFAEALQEMGAPTP